ncbi:aldehyde dehydrogenase family protein [Nonomuraea wenchangensis]
MAAAVAPWNFPLMLETWKIAPALAWGNTVVLKPAEDTPASATLLARLALEAGLPPGVLNVVHGYGPDSAGQGLTERPGVDRITFTGESATGRVISAAAARNLVPVSLELGGKGGNAVFAPAAGAMRLGDPKLDGTESLSRAHRVSARLRAGTVWVNRFFIRDLRAPSGGAGDSGVGID